LFQRRYERALGASGAGQALRLLAGAGNARELRQAEETGQLRLLAHPANSAAATASAPFTSGLGQMKKNMMTSAATRITVCTSPPKGRSKAPLGSSKYISLTMRR